MSFDASAVALRMAALGCPWRAVVGHVEQATSTQDLTRQAASAGAPEGTVFVADEQSQGRGRQGRAWVAPAGSALLASVLLRPAVAAGQLPPLALVVGLALHDALAPRLPPGALGLKWPNDLLIGQKKLVGVLVESSLRGDRTEAVVAGFGVNLLPAALPPEVASRAACLADHALPGAALSREAVLADALAAIQRRVAVFARQGLGPLLADLRAADATAGRRVRWQDRPAVARGIDDQGFLLLETSSGLVAAAAGEVTFEGLTIPLRLAGTSSKPPLQEGWRRTETR